MRLLLASLILAAPALALQAPAAAQDRIPEATLQNHQQACVSECAANRDEAYCAAVCSCVTDELRQHFTTAEFETRATKLSRDGDAAEVNREMEQIAAYCARNVGQ